MKDRIRTCGEDQIDRLAISRHTNMEFRPRIPKRKSNSLNRPNYYKLKR